MIIEIAVDVPKNAVVAILTEIEFFLLTNGIPHYTAPLYSNKYKTLNDVKAKYGEQE
jgi:hypothetical protein